jgi:DNA-binding PadR family transcriptional regulator
MLTDNQTRCLKALKRAPKTVGKVYEQFSNANSYMPKQSIRSCMRRLEEKSLVRAREQFDKKLGRNVIHWELTAKGRKVLAK